MISERRPPNDSRIPALNFRPAEHVSPSRKSDTEETYSFDEELVRPRIMLVDRKLDHHNRHLRRLERASYLCRHRLLFSGVWRGGGWRAGGLMGGWLTGSSRAGVLIRTAPSDPQARIESL